MWEGVSLIKDVWRLLLIFGMGTAGISLLAALVLLIASCIWGQKVRNARSIHDLLFRAVQISACMLCCLIVTLNVHLLCKIFNSSLARIG